MTTKTADDHTYLALALNNEDPYRPQMRVHAPDEDAAYRTLATYLSEDHGSLTVEEVEQEWALIPENTPLPDVR